MTGVRTDDPNDRVPHQHRRDVRGQKMLFAWLGHTDVKETNTLECLDAARAGRGARQRHALPDRLRQGARRLGPAGVHEHDGYSSHFDYGYGVRSLFTFGLWRRPWEGVRAPPLRGVGRFEAAHFDPGHVQPGELLHAVSVRAEGRCVLGGEDHRALPSRARPDGGARGALQ